MSSTQRTDDHYLTLGVPSGASQEQIRASYRRLAIVLHPDKNPDKPDATASFQRLVTAYEILGNPATRKVYDTARKQPNVMQQTQQATEKRKAEPEENHRRKTPAESASAQNEYKAQLQRLEQYRMFYENEISEARDRLEERKADLQTFQEQEAAALRQETQMEGWWPFTFLRPHKMSREEVEEQRRLSKERKNQERAARRRFIESGIESKEARINSLTSSLQNVMNQISTIRGKLEAEVQESTKEEERLRKEEEVRREAVNERAKKQWAQFSERQKALRKAAEHSRLVAQQAKEEFERATREMNAAREALAAHEGSAASHPSDANSNSGSTGGAFRNGCRHEMFWPRVRGMQFCQNCGELKWDLLFQCPGCQKIACLSCRESLRPSARGMRGSSNHVLYSHRPLV